jgi:cellulose synthase/poly-beta-1,6-N-acetylglucosamine synthase-like glycosyltransferase
MISTIRLASPEGVVFVSSAALLVWTWVVYSAWMVRAGRSTALHNTTRQPHVLPLPTVSVIIATREAPSVLVPRIENIRDTCGSARIGEIIVAVDSTASFELTSYELALGEEVRIVAGDPPGGKAATLNAGVRASCNDAIVLADSLQSFTEGSIPALLAVLVGDNVGGVSGTVRQNSGDVALDTYWRADSLIRAGQSARHSVVTSTGQIAAFWKRSYPVLPNGAICDDLYATTRIVLAGQHVRFTPDAVAVDTRTFTRAQNLQRKVRTLTGLMQVMRLLPQILNPFANPMWMHFVTQKLLRILTPLLVMGAGWAVVSLAASQWMHPTPSRILALITFAPLSTVGLPTQLAARLFGPASFFWAALVAVVNGVRGRFDVWEQHTRRSGPSITIGEAAQIGSASS